MLKRTVLLVFVPISIALIDDILVARVNRAQENWRAKDVLGKEAEFRLSVLPDRVPPRAKVRAAPGVEVPKRYYFRKEFPDCGKRVREGGRCAAGWALVPSAVLADRMCRAGWKEGVSAERVLACCRRCGAGCFGGYPWEAVKFLAGAGSTSETCQPYTVSDPPDPFRAQTPFCRYYGRCLKSNTTFYRLTVRDAYSVVDVEKEIMSRGPVLSYIKVFEDLMVYSDGVYSHVEGKFLGREAVEIVGWDVTPRGQPYWITETSWGKSWGENGTLRIIRGRDHLDIEKYAMAIIPNQASTPITRMNWPKGPYIRKNYQ